MDRCLICHTTQRRYADRCGVCKSNKYFDELGFDTGHPCTRCGTRTRLHSNSHCKFCLKEQGMAECSTCHEVKIVAMDFHQRQRVCRACRHKQSHLTRSERQRNRTLQQKYGVTIEQYDVLFRQQGGLCAICQRRSDTRRMAVDHNHQTGAVRGLLCSPCNVGLGMLKDSKEILERAVIYVRERGGGICTPDVPVNFSKSDWDRSTLESEVVLLKEQLAEERARHELSSGAAYRDLFVALGHATLPLFDPEKQKSTIAWLTERLAEANKHKTPPVA